VTNTKGSGADSSGTEEFQERWNFVGNYADFNGLKTGEVPFFTPAQAVTIPACVSAAGGAGTLGFAAMQKWGCYMLGSSVMVPPALANYGDLTRNTFRGNGLQLWDASIIKSIHFNERFSGEFRFEAFNVLNHEQFGNPQFNGAGGNLPFSNTGLNGSTGLGQSTQTPDVSNNNPSVGSGADRTIQLGFKVMF
jgi:hypothetical protein